MKRYKQARLTILLLFSCSVAVCASSYAADKNETKAGDLSLTRVLKLVMERHPGLKTAGLDVEAAKGRLIQAGLFPNPEFSFEAENFGGEGQNKQFESAEYTALIEQRMELGRKRSKRKHTAEFERQLTAIDAEVVWLDIRAETIRRFIEVAAAQERVTLGQELVGIAEEFLDAVSARVRAGKVSSTEETKATILLALQKISFAQAQSGLKSTRSMLCALWGDPVPRFSTVVGDLQNVAGVPSITVLTSKLPQNPDIARWNTELKQRQAALLLEKANRIPDLTVGGGVRRFNDTGENAFVFGGSIPLPFFNQNQGAIREAAAHVTRAEQERRKVENQTTADLTAAYNAYSTALIEATGLKNDVLPKTQSVFDVTKLGYMQGKFTYLDVLDAQRDYFETKSKYIEALAACHKAIAEIERLVNEDLVVLIND